MKTFKIYIKDNYFIAEEVGGTNLFHAYGSKEVRADVKYTGDDNFTFYHNHSGLEILGMVNIPYSNLQKEDGTPFASATEVANWVFENTQNAGGAGGGSTPTAELDIIQSELIPVLDETTELYLQITSVVDNTTGTVTSQSSVFYDKNLNTVTNPTNFELVSSIKEDFYKTYYKIGGITLEGYIKKDGSIYDLEFIQVIGAVPVATPQQTVTVANQTTVGNENKHQEVLAGNSTTISNVKCISLLIKGDCTVTIDGIDIDYEDGDSFSFSSENILVNDVTINQTTGKTIVLTLK